MRDCIYTLAECHHNGYKCSECPVTDLICDEFQNCLNISYSKGAKDIVARGQIASKNFHDGMLKMAHKRWDEIPISDVNARSELTLKILALNDCYTMFCGVWDELNREIGAKMDGEQ